jgi:hypothetical protein
MLYLNVPGPGDSTWIKFRRRVWIFIMYLCGPEVVNVTAMGQYIAAQQSVKDPLQQGYKTDRYNMRSLLKQAVSS